jgi:hypothetical protein
LAISLSFPNKSQPNAKASEKGKLAVEGSPNPPAYLNPSSLRNGFAIIAGGASAASLER